jgi:hypothetical protein
MEDDDGRENRKVGGKDKGIMKQARDDMAPSQVCITAQTAHQTLTNSSLNQLETLHKSG